MSNTTLTQLQEGLTTAYIDGTAAANLAYKPAFVSNNPDEGKKVISVIEDELMKCDQFQISVAFITMGGITPLLQTLKELEKRQIPGQILTTNYLNFSEPRALKKLQELSNVTLKMYDVDRADQGFHTKGYIFKKEEIYRIIIGSSNITSAALTKNKEWNTKIVSTEQGEIAMEIVKEFHQLWDSKYALFYDDFYENYKQKYEIIKKQREIAKRDEIASTEKYKLEPNSMQVGFITNLRRIVDAGENRALLISATGTGKTYASAFAMRELGFKRVLFLVHRSTLAKQALTSFRKVFEDKKSMGIVGAEQYFKGEQSSMKTIRVVAAVICDSIEHKTKIFSTARGYGEFKGGWEFPGGKIEAGETPQQAVVREIREELDATVRVGDLIDTIEYDYPAFHLSMDCFWCEVASGELKLLEAEAAKWLTKEKLDSVQWLPADVTLIDKIKSCMA